VKPSNRVIWVRSPERSILDGWKVQRVPGVVVRIYRHRVEIRIRSGERERLAIVDPENLISNDRTGETCSEPGSSA
jgi:hypothetical protein